MGRFKQFFTGFAIALVLGITGVRSVGAQVVVQASGQQGEAWLKYQDSKKSEWLAAGLEAMLPVIGNAYAGDAKKGLIPGVVRIVGFALMMDGATKAVDSVYGDGSSGTSELSIGYLAYLGGTGWGAVTAYQTAGKANAQLRKSFGISFAPSSRESGAYEFKVALATHF